LRRALIAGLILFTGATACSVDTDRATKEMPRPTGADEWVPSEGTVEKTLTAPTLGDRVVVFPAAGATKLRNQCSRPVVGRIQGTWRPDQATLARLEAALSAAFTGAIAKLGTRVPKQHSLDDYYRQYGGIVVDGRRIVYINAFHGLILYWAATVRPARPIDWQHVAVDACGGGTMFFGAEFDVESGRIVVIEFNGPR
jgi:hypothetical protein